MVSIDKPPQKLTRLKAKERKMIRDEEETTATTTICDILPTLANTVIPMARYETVRLQIRRRAPANAGVTDRTRDDVLFRNTEPLRIKYKTIKKDWPVEALALSGLDAEIYRRVFARQHELSPYRGENYQKDILERTEILINRRGEIRTNNKGEPLRGVTTASRVKAFEDLLTYAADRDIMTASMGTDIFTGNGFTNDKIDKDMFQRRMLTAVSMGYILRVYLAVDKYDRTAVINPWTWITTAQIRFGPNRASKSWLAAEIFKYKIPPSALPLGTDESDRILLNQCGISLILFILNEKDHHWTLLAYPVRKNPAQRKLYHYDSLSSFAPLSTIQTRSEHPDNRLVKGGLFSIDIFDTIDGRPSKYKYFTNPSWSSKTLSCKQPSGWRCGYMALGVIDILCRKTEHDPSSMTNPQGSNLDPLQLVDIPDYTKRTRVTGDLANYMDDILTKSKGWVKDVARKTVWKVLESSSDYVDGRGADAPDNNPPSSINNTIPPISAVFKANTSWQSFSWDDYDD